jgi:DNA-binding response OmpR family regulator
LHVSITATDIAMPALGGRRVLVVESGADDAAALAAMLRLKGFDARTARTGADALAAAAANQPQVVVLDLDLPDADGCELIRRLREPPDPPEVVVVTGHTGPAVRRAVIAAGAAAYLLKPAEPTELTALVDRLGQPRG